MAMLLQFQTPAIAEFDCPVHKWQLSHDIETSCNGCSKSHLNAIRQHLLPDYSRQHLQFVSFIKRCPRCKEDVLSESGWQDEGHASHTCPARTQPRDMSILVWTPLYLKIFPNETEIPSPCMCNATHDSIETDCSRLERFSLPSWSHC
jgi:hypothetical protein